MTHSLRNLRIGHRLALSFTGVVALIALLAVLLFGQLSSVQGHTHEFLGEQAERLRLANEWRQGILLNAERAAAMVHSTEPSLAARFEPEMKKTTARISEIQKRFGEIETSEAGIAAQQAVAQKRATYLDARKTLLAGDNRQDAARMHAFNDALTAYVAAAQALVALEEQRGETMGAEVIGIVSATRTELVVAALASVLLAAGLGVWLTRSIVRPLSLARASAERIAGGDLTEAVPSGGTDEVGQLLSSLAQMQQSLRQLAGEIRSSADSIGVASAEVAAGNQDLSVRTEQMSANLQAAASSVEQIVDTMRQGADSAREADDLARRASGVASEGGEAMSRVVSTMTTISESSSRIGEIVGVIDGIAFQTNILALNAAVEAARAGEQGRGFAVVAGEVRALAQRSATAAKEIKLLIDESVGRVEAGARQAQDAGRTIKAVVGDVQRVSSIISGITRAAGEQAQGISEVNRAVSQLDQVTQQNAALVEESAAAAASLKDQADGLSASAHRFKLA